VSVLLPFQFLFVALSDGIKKVFTQAEIYFINDLGYLSLISAFNCPEIF